MSNSNSKIDWYISIDSLKDMLDALTIDYAIYDDALQVICDLSDWVDEGAPERDKIGVVRR